MRSLTRVHHLFHDKKVFHPKIWGVLGFFRRPQYNLACTISLMRDAMLLMFVRGEKTTKEKHTTSASDARGLFPLVAYLEKKNMQRRTYTSSRRTTRRHSLTCWAEVRHQQRSMETLITCLDPSHNGISVCGSEPLPISQGKNSIITINAIATQNKPLCYHGEFHKCAIQQSSVQASWIAFHHCEWPRSKTRVIKVAKQPSRVWTSLLK